MSSIESQLEFVGVKRTPGSAYWNDYNKRVLFGIGLSECRQLKKIIKNNLTTKKGHFKLGCTGQGVSCRGCRQILDQTIEETIQKHPRLTSGRHWGCQHHSEFEKLRDMALRCLVRRFWISSLKENKVPSKGCQAAAKRAQLEYDESDSEYEPQNLKRSFGSKRNFGKDYRSSKVREDQAEGLQCRGAEVSKELYDTAVTVDGNLITGVPPDSFWRPKAAKNGSRSHYQSNYTITMPQDLISEISNSPTPSSSSGFGTGQVSVVDLTNLEEPESGPPRFIDLNEASDEEDVIKLQIEPTAFSSEQSIPTPTSMIAHKQFEHAGPEGTQDNASARSQIIEVAESARPLSIANPGSHNTPVKQTEESSPIPTSDYRIQTVPIRLHFIRPFWTDGFVTADELLPRESTKKIRDMSVEDLSFERVKEKLASIAQSRRRSGEGLYDSDADLRYFYMRNSNEEDFIETESQLFFCVREQLSHPDLYKGSVHLFVIPKDRILGEYYYSEPVFSRQKKDDSEFQLTLNYQDFQGRHTRDRSYERIDPGLLMNDHLGSGAVDFGFSQTGSSGVSETGFSVAERSDLFFGNCN